MRGFGSLPFVLPFFGADDPADRSGGQSERPLPQGLPSIDGPGSNALQDNGVLPIPHKEHRSECDRRIEELKHSHEQLLKEKDVRIEELRKEKDTQIEELKRERDARLEELMKERDSRIEDIKEEKDARIEEVKRDREVAVKNMEEQLERCRREVSQLREENDRLKDGITTLKAHEAAWSASRMR